MTTRNRVFVTGLGVTTSLGLDWPTFWDNLLAGRSGIRRWAPEGYEDFPVKFAAPVDRQALAAACANEGILDEAMEHRTAFGVAAARKALRDAGLEPGAASLRATAVVVGSGVPERDPNDMLLALGEGGPSWNNLIRNRARRNPRLRQNNDALADLIARQNGCRGPSLNVSTACAGAAQAIGIGLRMIRRGEAERVLCGGADSVLNLPTMTGLLLLGAPSLADNLEHRLSRPFDRDRNGFVAAEGAGMVLLESEAAAVARGATPYAELAGFGCSADAHRVTAPHPEGLGAAAAMRRALADGGAAPERVGCINAHGTSTPLNDPIETAAIKAVFAEGEHYRRLAVSANKSQLGHLIAASGAPEFIATVLTVRDGHIPPTLNLANPDPLCDLDYVSEGARRQAVDYALSNSFGFGGFNVSLLVKRHGAA
jgi:3-oxoacyl-[acyl-carrier-protein] synthase II